MNEEQYLNYIFIFLYIFAPKMFNNTVLGSHVQGSVFLEILVRAL